MLQNSYCKFVENLEEDNVHKIYHDTAYGFPITNDNELFERLILEINQAGLSWEIILKKQENFKKAYDHFQIEKVANYNEKDRESLLKNAGIIRNKLKVNAAIYNANAIISLQKEYGSFYKWLQFHHPKTKEEWVSIFKKNFKFVGGEIVNEFLMSIGFLKGAHCEYCKMYSKIIEQEPMWLKH